MVMTGRNSQQSLDSRRVTMSEGAVPAENRVRIATIDVRDCPWIRFMPMISILDAIWNGLATRRRLNQEIVDTHPVGRLCWTPRAAGVLEVPDQFLLLGIHRDRRLLPPLGRPHAPRDVAKLRVPVHVLTAFARLDVALQAVPKPV